MNEEEKASRDLFGGKGVRLVLFYFTITGLKQSIDVSRVKWLTG